MRDVLAEMRIQGLGVIDDATLELHPGLTVITGETGAGKTMVVTGLHLLSGGRADASRVRAGAERAVVEGRFITSADSGAAAVAADAGAELDEDGSLIALRTVTADGRSRAHLGGRSVPKAVLSCRARKRRCTAERSPCSRTAEQRGARPVRREPVLSVLKTSRSASGRRPLRVDRTPGTPASWPAELLRHRLEEIESVAPESSEDELVERARRLPMRTSWELAGAVHQALVGDARRPVRRVRSN